MKMPVFTLFSYSFQKVFCIKLWKVGYGWATTLIWLLQAYAHSLQSRDKNSLNPTAYTAG